MVLLKDFVETGFVFYTNYESRKGLELAENPNAALVFYWRQLERQICIMGTVSKVSREESEAYFRTRPRGSQIGALTSSQSQVVASREVLENRFQQLLAEYEGREIPLPSYWGGYRLSPATIEFWQGRSDRLHARIFYQRQSGGPWQLERLSPFALREVSFDIPPGLKVAIVGRSGSGKSTLLHLAAGIDVRTQGEVSIRGRNLAALSDRARTLVRRQEIGLVFQFFYLLPHLSVRENVCLPGFIAGEGVSEFEERASELLEEVGLLDRAEDNIQELSGGEMQRVAICRSLLRKRPETSMMPTVVW